jgi:hypothetical protein
LRGFLAKQGTLAQFSCPGAHAQNGVAERKHRHMPEMARALMIAASLPPHFWAEAISTLAYLINLQPSAALHGGIPLERLFARSPNFSAIRSFGCVCYVLLVPRERTKLTAQSVECVFLGYSDEYKGYRCWDPVGRQMRISPDVKFDESRSFYPRPSSSAFLVKDIYFLLFPNTPSSVPVDPPPRPLLDDAPSFPPPPSSPPSPSPFPSDPPPTTMVSTFPFHYSRRSHVLDASSSSSSNMPSSSDEMTPPLSAHQRRPPDRLLS